jgi:hypothetical protein
MARAGRHRNHCGRCARPVTQKTTGARVAIVLRFSKWLEYDKDKKILNGGPMSSSQNGTPILKAGETKKFAAGKKKDEIPGVVTIQVEVSAGAYGDGSQWKNPALGHYERAQKD